MKYLSLLICCAIAPVMLSAQFSSADSLRGGYGPTRNWWDLRHYDLHVTFDEASKSISGYNVITYTNKTGDDRHKVIQIDLQQPMQLDSILFGNKRIPDNRITRNGNACFFDASGYGSKIGENSSFTVYYHGIPHEAVKAPWDGGVIWKKDANGNPWITVACQGLGASVWFPCKDSQADEPDSVTMHYTCNSKLVCVSNGKFIDREEHPNGQSTFTWHVSNPINNYCMIPYIGDYVNIHEHYKGEKGMLELDYWVIRGNEEKAEKQFLEAPRTIEALEYWFGPYPFYEDGYKLVEAPHLGMEHQSAVAYGNGFMNGYMGSDLSNTGEGLKWDFIIVHESGHEWFGNNITSTDIADMWIHESFTNYSETLFMDYWFGTEHANTYCIGLRRNIMNDRPVIGNYGVNSEGSSDMYYKGSNMLHTIRQLVANDSVFRQMLREMNARFYHQTVTTGQIEQFMTDYLKLDLKPIFDQYLRCKNPPELQMKLTRKKVKFRWVNCVKGFHMPVYLDGYGWVEPAGRWKKIALKEGVKPEVNQNFYVLVNETH